MKGETAAFTSPDGWAAVGAFLDGSRWRRRSPEITPRYISRPRGSRASIALGAATRLAARRETKGFSASIVSAKDISACARDARMRRRIGWYAAARLGDFHVCLPDGHCPGSPHFCGPDCAAAGGPTVRYTMACQPPASAHARLRRAPPIVIAMGIVHWVRSASARLN